MYEWQSTIKLPKCLLYLYCKRSKVTNIANERRKQKEGDKECGIREERRIE